MTEFLAGKIYLRSPQKDIELSEVLENGRALLATSSELTLAFRNSSAFPFERELDDLNVNNILSMYGSPFI